MDDSLWETLPLAMDLIHVIGARVCMCVHSNATCHVGACRYV